MEGQSNICYVASDNGMGGIVWTSEAETGAYFSDARYFAYYPYSEELSFVPDPSADDASGFFAGLISSYEVPDDQRMKETFDSADLMIGMASVSGGNNAAFVMEHAMSLILIGLPLEYYSFDNTDYAVPDYVIGGSRNAVFDGFTLDLDGTIENASDGAGQFFWYDMGDVVAKMNVPMEKISAEDKDEFFVGGAIWTSSIADNDAARAVSFNNEGYVHCRWAWKDLGYFARAVLAF